MVECSNMTGEKEFVLVITTTYNRACMLPEAIDSFLAQDYPYKKMVIIDDGSTDQTKETLTECLNNSKGNILYYYKENGGCASARNFGLDLIDDTIGYVCFLDSDDRLLPGKLHREVAFLKSFPGADFVYSDTVMYNETTKKEKTSKAAAAGNPEHLAIKHFLTNRICCGSILYRVPAIIGKRFDSSLRFNEDSDFFQQLCIDGKAIYSPIPGYWVREHQGSKSKNLVEIQKAVLDTNKRIIHQYPAFYRQFKRSMDRRNRKIARMHFTALMSEKRYDEAKEYVKNPFCRRAYYLFLHCVYSAKPFIKILIGR
jgi:glycosyltransferase involved in cell wall biosynthesis